nr:integrase, catalytic region, zinc finger, CCHC-type, peptidase aspartic, catalytic [Tanacetum cinerariifolium]
MEAEVDQNAINLMSGEIERNNLLITNENLIAKYISHDVFYTVTNSALTASQFHELSIAYNVAKTLAVKLEAEILNLHKKIQNDDHDNMVKHLSRLEVDNLNFVTKASRSQPRSNKKIDRTLKAKNGHKKNVEAHRKKNKSDLHKKNHVDSGISFKRVVVNSNSNSHCKTRNKCMILFNHDECVAKFLKSSNKSPVKKIWRVKQVKQTWQPTGTVFTKVGYQWKPTGRTFTLGEQCPLTRNSKPNVVTVKQWKPTGKIIALGCQTVRFGNDHFRAIIGYGDYVIGDSLISTVYYVEGMGHNLFSVGQFCDFDLEVAFRKHTCFFRDLDGVDLIKGTYGTNLYTISVEDMMRSSFICLLSKASKNKSWLWHHRLNHLNFDTISDLARKDLVRGLPRLKFEKDHLCSACQLGKSKKYALKPKTVNTIMEVLHTLHMDLCGQMRVQSINGKKFILVIIDDYSWFTLVKFLRTKDETPEAKADIRFFVGYTPDYKGYQIYNKRTRKIMETIHVTFNELTRQMAPDHISSGPTTKLLTPGYISSGLVQNSFSLTPYVPPSKKYYEILFQQLFDEYFNPPPRAISPVSIAVAALRAVDSASSPLSTSIDQYVPSASTSPTIQEIQSQVTHQGAEE